MGHLLATKTAHTDCSGNLLGMAATPENITAWPAPGDRLMRFATPSGQATFAYDGHGNRITRTVSGKEERYRYDGAHQLTGIEHANGTRTQYEYDALGRRVAKHITKGGQTQTTLFVWDEDWLVQEVKAGMDAKPVTYIAHPDQAGPLAKLENGTTYHYVTDHLGTPQEMHDSEGRIVWAADFSAYGKVRRTLANEVENPIRFAGQYFDAESGLHYNRFRYYDPNTGRYVNQDPIGLDGGFNVYAYVKGFSILFSDSYDLCKCNEIASTAKKNEGSEKWNIIEFYNTCKIGVFNSIKQAGGPAPERWKWILGKHPLGAGEGGWGNPITSILGWTRVSLLMSEDVTAGDGGTGSAHARIVVERKNVILGTIGG